jgi:hypothetical protein
MTSGQMFKVKFRCSRNRIDQGFTHGEVASSIDCLPLGIAPICEKNCCPMNYFHLFRLPPPDCMLLPAPNFTPEKPYHHQNVGQQQQQMSSNLLYTIQPALERASN